MSSNNVKLTRESAVEMAAINAIENSIEISTDVSSNSEEVDTKGIDNLPNECLQLILDYLPFEDLLENAPLVCSKWNEMAKFVCNRKTALNLYGDSDSFIPEPMTKIFCKYIGLNLQGDTATSLSCKKYCIRQEAERNRELLKRKFPNINTLNVIHFRLTPDLESLYALMKVWPELSGFKLVVYRAKDDMDRASWGRIYREISGIPNLRRLALFCRCPVGDVDPEDMYSLGQIQQLQIGGFSVNLKELRSVTKLSIYHLEGDQWQDQMVAMNGDVAQQITDLTIYPANDQLQLPYIETVCHKFPSVRNLHIRTRLPLAEVLPPLAKLTELSHLRIWHHMERFSIISDIDQADLPSMPQLNSVVMLHLYLRLCHHTQLDWISHVFPRLKWIKFDRFRSECPNCSQDGEHQCEMMILAPLKKCTQLKRIFIDRKALRIENCPLESLTSYDELSPDEL